MEQLEQTLHHCTLNELLESTVYQLFWNFPAQIFKCLAKKSIGGRYGTSLQTPSGIGRNALPLPTSNLRLSVLQTSQRWAQIWISTRFSPLPSKEFVLWPASNHWQIFPKFVQIHLVGPFFWPKAAATIRAVCGLESATWDSTNRPTRISRSHISWVDLFEGTKVDIT